MREINGEEILKKKAQIVIEVYLDSAIPPKSQIDVTHEMSNKLLRAALRITRGDFVSSDLAIFEEAKCLLLNELLIQYWGKYCIFFKILI